MNLFSSTEVFSLEIRSPSKPGSKEETVVYSLWRNGVYTIRKTDSSFLDEKPEGYTYKLTPNAYSKIEDYIKKVNSAFVACPNYIFVDGVKGSAFTLVLNSKTVNGFFAIFPKELIEDERYNFTKSDIRKMKWSNEVVEFSKTVTSLLDEFGNKGALRLMKNKTSEIEMLKPSTRDYIMSFRDDFGLKDASNVNRDTIIKKTIKMSLGDFTPTGETLYSIISLIKAKAILIVNNSDTIEEFDDNHRELCLQILEVLGDGFNYGDAAKILDMLYLHLLLMFDRIHMDKQVLFLHYPTPEDDVYCEESYLEFQKRKRIGIKSSPILNYLSLNSRIGIVNDSSSSTSNEA